jgi:hypothetical protein
MVMVPTPPSVMTAAAPPAGRVRRFWDKRFRHPRFTFKRKSQARAVHPRHELCGAAPAALLAPLTDLAGPPMSRSLLRRVLAGAAALTFARAAPASAHVTVSPNAATQGGYIKVAFRVPNEKDGAETTKLATLIKTDDGEIAEAVSKITWAAGPGAGIKPGQFEEFEVSLGPPPDTDHKQATPTDPR